MEDNPRAAYSGTPAVDNCSDVSHSPLIKARLNSCSWHPPEGRLWSRFQLNNNKAGCSNRFDSCLRSVRQSSQLAIEKVVCSLVGECCSLGVIMRPAMPREGVILTRIAVNRRVWFLSKRRFDLSLCSLRNEFVLLG